MSEAIKQIKMEHRHLLYEPGTYVPTSAGSETLAILMLVAAVRELKEVVEDALGGPMP